MKNSNHHLSRFRSRCQAGLPVWFDHRPDGTTSLRLGTSSDPSPAVPLLYARLDRPTGRLLLHFVITSGSVSPGLLSGDVFCVPKSCIIGASVSRLLDLTRGKQQLREGRHPLLNDGHFLTASVRIRCAQREVETYAKNTYQDNRRQTA